MSSEFSRKLNSTHYFTRKHIFSKHLNFCRVTIENITTYNFEGINKQRITIQRQQDAVLHYCRANSVSYRYDQTERIDEGKYLTNHKYMDVVISMQICTY